MIEINKASESELFQMHRTYDSVSFAGLDDVLEGTNEVTVVIKQADVGLFHN